MSDDLLSLRLLVVAQSASLIDVWRQGSALASMPIDFTEAASAGAAAQALRKSAADIVVVDGDLSGSTEVVEAVREMTTKPLLVSIAASKPGTVRPDGFDGLLPRPADSNAARAAVDRCIKATMPLRAVIVDDSQTMRAIVGKILDASRFKLSVTEASEGNAAIAEIGKGAVDIVFLDYNMPGLNGVDTLMQIKKDKPDIAVVIMTSALDPGVMKRAQDAGAIGFLKKPFFPKDVDTVLEKYHGLQG